VAREPTWSPDGRSLVFLGRRDRDKPLRETFDWWWVPSGGGTPTRTSVLDQHDWRVAYQRELINIGVWTSNGVLFSVRGSLWMLPLSLDAGRISGPPRQLTLGAGTYRTPTAIRDGRVVFAQTLVERVVERVGLADDGSPPVRLYTDGSPVNLR